MTILLEFESVSGRYNTGRELATSESEECVGYAAVDLQFSGFVVVAQVCHEAVCWSDAEWDEEGKSEVIFIVFVSGVQLSGGLGEFRARLKAVVDRVVALQGSQISLKHRKPYLSVLQTSLRTQRLENQDSKGLQLARPDDKTRNSKGWKITRSLKLRKEHKTI